MPIVGAPALSERQAQLVELALTDDGICLVETANRLATWPETLLDEIRFLHTVHGFGYIKLRSGNYRLLPYRRCQPALGRPPVRHVFARFD